VRVEKRDLAAEETPPWALVDELGPGSSEARKLDADVGDLESEVVHACALLGEELPDGAVRTVRGE